MIPESPLEYFQALERCYQDLPGAADAATLQVGPLAIAIETKQPLVREHITRAFQHALVPQIPDSRLQVLVWDATDSADALPPKFWHRNTLVDRGDVPELSSATIKAIYSDFNSSFSMIDLERSLALHVVWGVNEDSPPATAPLRQVLHVVTQPTRALVLHGACVSDQGRGILLVGPGGAGKSTTSALCAQAGFGWLGDDSVLVEIDQQVAHTLYATLRLVQDNPAATIKDSSETPCVAIDGKQVFFVDRQFPGAIEQSVPICAVVLVRQGGEPRLKPGRMLEIATALAQSTVLSLSHSGELEMQKIKRLLAALPLFTLTVPRSLDEVPTLVREVFSRTAT